MNRSTLNIAALVDLKAELLRKREVANKLKHQRNADVEPTSFKLKKQQPEKPQRPAPVSKDSRSDDFNEEEENALRKSREMLEKKSKLYEKISRGEKILDDEENERYLVDFGNKPVLIEGDPTDDFNASKNTNAEEEHSNFEEPINNANATNDDWVDYLDKRGNEKRCLREDLPVFQSTKNMDGERKTKSPFWENIDSKLKPVAPESVKLDIDEEVGPVHYENVRQEEIRVHGVGYFTFSESEEQRKEQLEMLNNMREQTLKQREMRQRMKEKRSALLAARLAKVKQRKNIVVEDDQDSEEEIPVEDIPLPEVAAVPEEDQEVLKKKPTKIRPWDKGKDFSEIHDKLNSEYKKKTASSTNYYEERRAERQSDFAPPTLYFQNKRKKASNDNVREYWNTGNDESLKESVDTEIPEPQQNDLDQNNGVPPWYQNLGVPNWQGNIGMPSNEMHFQQPAAWNTQWNNSVPVYGYGKQQYNSQIFATAETTTNSDDVCDNESEILKQRSIDSESASDDANPELKKEDVEKDVAEKLKFFRNKF